VNLIPGRYRLEVARDGFKQFIHESIYVPLDSSVHIDATLALGSMKETVEVKDQTPLLESQGCQLGGRVSWKLRVTQTKNAVGWAVAQADSEALLLPV
jgi:hypothetical protein